MIEILAFSTDGLRRDATEVEGWGAGNEAAQMRWAADEIERLRAALRINCLRQGGTHADADHVVFPTDITTKGPSK